MSPQATLDKKPRGEVQVREVGGERYVLTKPTIANDTLTGMSRTGVRRVALAAIDRVAVRKDNILTILGVGAIVVGVLGVIYAEDDSGYGF